MHSLSRHRGRPRGRDLRLPVQRHLPVAVAGTCQRSARDDIQRGLEQHVGPLWQPDERRRRESVTDPCVTVPHAEPAAVRGRRMSGDQLRQGNQHVRRATTNLRIAAPWPCSGIGGNRPADGFPLHLRMDYSSRPGGYLAPPHEAGMPFFRVRGMKDAGVGFRPNPSHPVFLRPLYVTRRHRPRFP